MTMRRKLSPPQRHAQLACSSMARIIYYNRHTREMVELIYKWLGQV